MRMIAFILIGFLLYACNICKTCTGYKTNQIEKIIIFNWKNTHGINSGQLKNEFKKIDSLQIPVLPLEDSINMVLLNFVRSAKVTRHIPTKLQGDILFGQISYNETWINCIFLPTKIITLEGVELTLENANKDLIYENYKSALIMIDKSIR